MQANKIFEHPEFGKVRTVMIDGEPWFVAADVCNALDIGNPSQALSRLDEDEKIITLISNEGNQRGNPNVAVVNEPGLYTLILGSRKPEAKAFKRWITHEVLPTLRNAAGLDAADALRMLSRENQKKGNRYLYEAGLGDRKHYCAAAKVAGKAMGMRLHKEKAVPKDEIPAERLPEYDKIFSETVKLFDLKDRYGIEFSVSTAIYGQYGDKK
nr:MAG TPA: repressor domain protein [Caudoviricetes sp.]